MDSGGGVTAAEASPEWVDVSEEDRRAAYDCSQLEFPATCLKKKATALTKGGLSVRLERFSQEVELDDEHVQVIRRDWGGLWEEEFYNYLNIFGFAVVKPVPHPRSPGEARMLLVPWNKYKLSFTHSSMHEREYWVTYTDANYDSGAAAAGGRLTALTHVNNRVQPNEVRKPPPPLRFRPRHH